MKKSEFYKNEYPLEELLPPVEIEDASAEVEPFEFEFCFEDLETLELKFTKPQKAAINLQAWSQAAEFYKMGYDAAKAEIEKKLKPL